MDMKLQPQDEELSKLIEAPINFSSHIQPHGILLVLQESNLKILQVSSNTLSILGITHENMLSRRLVEFLTSEEIERFNTALSNQEMNYMNPTKIWLKLDHEHNGMFDAVFHRNSDGVLILELESITTQESVSFLSFYNLVSVCINRLKKVTNLGELGKIITEEVRKITGFDRVMLYRFNPTGHGSVIAESKLANLASYLGLNYPESDIPEPARQLLITNPIRVIPDVNAEAVPILPAIYPLNQQPLDLSNSILRSISPCHIEYLHNMGVEACLTISLIHQERLWGLIICNHQSPRFVSYETRKICKFLGRVIFSEISTREEMEDYDYSLRVAGIHSLLVESMSKCDNFIDALVKHKSSLLDLTNSQGTCVYFDESYAMMGDTPEKQDIKFLVEWLNTFLDDEYEIYSTDCLRKVYSNGANIQRFASGLLAISIGEGNYLLWFRPEVNQIVNWGGNPHHPFNISQIEGKISLSPRKSFGSWQEVICSTSLPWKSEEIKAALGLRKAIVNVILHQTHKLTKLTRSLERSNEELKKFAYVTSHDLQAPLNQVVNYIQLLAIRYESELDPVAKEFISYAVEGVTLMQNLIDDVLTYSQVDAQELTFELTSVENCLELALKNLRQSIKEVRATITHTALPTVIADRTQLVQLFLNLISNSIKFHNNYPLKIHIGVEGVENEWLFSVKDNGIGIEPQFHQRIFVIFQQLHVRDEYMGTGVGLAICKKIIERHQGRIWVDSQLGQGTTFYFTIPAGEYNCDRGNNHKT